MKTKNFIVALMSTIAIAAFAAVTVNQSFAANTTTNTTLGIIPGSVGSGGSGG